jgi:hypothetical protein
VSKAPHCWKNGMIRGQKIRSILCQFHALKAWIENLLPKVPHSCHHVIWHQLHILMYFDDESNFDEKVFNFTNMGGVENVILVNNSIRKTHHFNIGL